MSGGLDVLLLLRWEGFTGFDGMYVKLRGEKLVIIVDCSFCGGCTVSWTGIAGAASSAGKVDDGFGSGSDFWLGFWYEKFVGTVDIVYV